MLTNTRHSHTAPGHITFPPPHLHHPTNLLPSDLRPLRLEPTRKRPRAAPTNVFARSRPASPLRPHSTARAPRGTILGHATPLPICTTWSVGSAANSRSPAPIPPLPHAPGRPQRGHRRATLLPQTCSTSYERAREGLRLGPRPRSHRRLCMSHFQGACGKGSQGREWGLPRPTTCRRAALRVGARSCVAKCESVVARRIRAGYPR
jgi:hypothetical protein